MELIWESRLGILWRKIWWRTRPATAGEFALLERNRDLKIQIRNLTFEIEEMKLQHQTAIRKQEAELDARNEEVEALAEVIERDRLRVQAERAILEDQIARTTKR